MGLFDKLLNRGNTNSIKDAQLDKALFQAVSRYKEDKYGTEYVTIEEQERRAKEEIRKAELRKLREKRLEEEEKLEVEEQTTTSESGRRYSISEDADRETLSSEADDYMSILLNKSESSVGSNKESLDYIRYSRISEVSRQAKQKLARKSFSALLVKYINRTGMSNAEVYKRANLSKSVFSSIMSDSNHLPKKNNIIALAIALRLDLKEAETLLMKAGYTFSNSIDTDLVAVYCINHRIYDIDKINRILYEMNAPLLGSKM